MADSFFDTDQGVYTTPAVPLSSDYFLYDKYTPPKGNPNDNPFYVCYITCPDKDIYIKANLPQEYSLDVGTAYESSFSQSVSQHLSDGQRKVGGALGFQFATKSMTAKIWQGSNDLTFTIPMIFQLESDYYADILDPLSKLYQLVLPKQSQAFGLLESPGPVLDLAKLKQLAPGSLAELESAGANLYNQIGSSIDGLSKMVDSSKDSSTEPPAGTNDPTAFLLNCIKNNCSLVIGGYQFFDSVVVTNVAQTTQVLPYYATGTMTRVEVAVTFSTFVVPTQDDIPHLLIGSMRDKGLQSQPGTVASADPTLPGSENASDLLDAGLYGEQLSTEAYEDYLNNSSFFA